MMETLTKKKGFWCGIQKELINKLGIIKEWIIKEKNFLILLAVMTVSLAVSMFTEYALLACMAVAVVCAVCFNFENCLSLFLFSYAFEAVFYADISSNTFVFPIFYSLIFGICAIKYLIKVIKKEIKINWKVLIPILIFIVYLVVPINKITLKDLIRCIVTLGFIYLIEESWKKVRFENVVICGVIGFIISMIFSPIADFIPRMILHRGVFYNENIIKTQGLFVNPNCLVIFGVVLIAYMMYKFVFYDWFWFFPLLITLPYVYATISRNFIICLCLVCLLLLIYVCIKRQKVFIFRFLFSLLLIGVVIISQSGITKIYVNRIHDTIGDVIYILKENKNNSGGDDVIEKPVNNETSNEVQKDELVVDPGRINLWKRYIKQVASSTKNILFGCGASAENMGLGTHNTFVEIFWRFGLIGSALLCVILVCLVRVLIKNWSKHVFLMLVVILFINLVESCLFGGRMIMLITMLFACIKSTNIENIKEKIDEQDISDSTNL